MLKTPIFTAVAGMLLFAMTGSSFAAGDYYEGASKESRRSTTDPIQTNSTSSYGYASGNTSRDNQQFGDTARVNSGDYYSGANRPN
ncbi:MAG: hypothetical protein KJ947_19130 [Alphaproteobacteria bacterium]|jgi:hypothetical protein|nr:hypothetical protein [Alphaproteobacteria bacterium]MBU1551664.1 hypothetical protein [Alphaproteobacteria bacterium]MBU2337399.1 hypothetical protein [Alphaproteobacteria bacterium]MBU2388142.1 hypothetical protein [Alphaproteobacteria bacterium]